ncbi:hypothetical protein Dxin01_00096 [Deinococcus xinjiangensis]|uniref:Uncharacterized protein n=1 Tax=Deinococcus xinjiangensis TaxID=457454 RepID=A0ABP9V880_9DEIO
MKKPLVMLAFMLASVSAAPSGQPVLLSAYSAQAAQTDSTPNHSACGRTKAVQVALSPDLLAQYPCGSWVRVYRPDTGRWHRYQVWDSMARRKRNQVDILMPSHRAAVQFGVRRGLLQ